MHCLLLRKSINKPAQQVNLITGSINKLKKKMMAQICKICSHPDRLKIDQAIVSGTSLKEISRRFNVTYDSLYRHAQDHLTRQLTKAWQIKSLHEDNKLIDKIAESTSVFTTDNRENFIKYKNLYHATSSTLTKEEESITAKQMFGNNQKMLPLSVTLNKIKEI